VARFLSAIFAFAVAAALAGSGRAAWVAGADARLLGEMPQAVVGQFARQDPQIVRHVKVSSLSPPSLPCGLLPVGTYASPPGVEGPVQLAPKRVAEFPGPTRSPRITRGPPGSDLPATKS
jgi:hypothetical protein